MEVNFPTVYAVKKINFHRRYDIFKSFEDTSIIIVQGETITTSNIASPSITNLKRRYSRKEKEH